MLVSSSGFIADFPDAGKQRKLYLVSRNDLDEDKDMAETTPPVSNKMAANSHDWSFWSGVILSQPAGGQVRQTPLYLIGNGVTPLQFLRAGGPRGMQTPAKLWLCP